MTFNASASSDANGFVAGFAWDFGDGVNSTGMTVTHAFSAPGLYWITLVVTDNESRTDRSERSLPVVEALELVPYESAAGFRMPVPRAWSLAENVLVGGLKVELQLLGPTYGQTRTNILVDTDRDATVREDTAYLDPLMDRVVAELRRDHPSLLVTEGPRHRMIAGHLSVTFVVGYGKLTQRITILVSDEHDRYWNFVLTADAGYFPTGNATLERMLDGFAISLSPPGSIPTSTLFALILATSVGGMSAAAVAFIVMTLMRRNRKPAGLPPLLPTVPPPIAPAPGFGMTIVIRFCPHCGVPAEPGGSFCPSCGSSLRL